MRQTEPLPTTVQCWAEQRTGPVVAVRDASHDWRRSRVWELTGEGGARWYAGRGRTRCGPAGAVLGALRKTLRLVDGTEVLTVNHDGVWLGIPLNFSAGHPTVALPELDPDEQLQFTAARTKLDSAYQQILQGETAC